jgi:glycosyltransferase involved in cell wall biosynthesis
MRATSSARTVVVVTDRVLFPCREGSQTRIIELVTAIRAAGYSVVLVGRRIPWRRFPRLPGVRSTLRTRKLVDELVSVEASAFSGGSPTSVDLEPYAQALRRVIARHRPVAVIAEYLWMAPCLRVVPEGILRIVDTLDVMHERTAMYQGEPEGAWVECTWEEEAALLRHADVVLAIQHHEREVFARMLPTKTVICLPHIVSPALWAEAEDATEDVVAFVGSRIQGNVVGLHDFLDDAWPVVRAQRPHARIHVYGDVVTRLEREVPGLRRVGYVSDISDAYRATAVVINPVTLGTGLKIKSVEALAHGRALVTTSCGAAGIEAGAPHAFLIEDDMVRFGSAVAALLENPVRRHAMAVSARAFAAERFSRDGVMRALCGLLDQHGPAAAAL